MRTFEEVEAEMEAIRNMSDEMRTVLARLPGYGTEAFVIPEPYESRRKAAQDRYMALKDEMCAILGASGQRWDGRAHLAYAGIGEGDERPFRERMPIPGEFSAEERTGF